MQGRDIYNVTAPFIFNHERLLAGRVEHRDSELSEIVLFAERNSVWYPCYSLKHFTHLQDPCVTVIDGLLIVGGVKYPARFADGRTGWMMDFYAGSSPESLRPLFSGPPGMKDIRLCKLADGRIGVLTRPQGGIAGRGTIGFAIADKLCDITPEMIASAPLLTGQFAPGEWGGGNEAHLLDDGRLGVLGHIAWWDTQGCRHYYPMSFVLDPLTRERTPIRMIACRDWFPAAPAKRPDLADVVFSGGLLRHPNGTAHLYAGLSDAAAGMIEIADPFASAA
jgi:hypothetical protein